MLCARHAKTLAAAASSLAVSFSVQYLRVGEDTGAAGELLLLHTVVAVFLICAVHRQVGFYCPACMTSCPGMTFRSRLSVCDVRIII